MARRACRGFVAQLIIGATLSVASTGMVRTPEGKAVALSPSFSGRAPAPPQ